MLGLVLDRQNEADHDAPLVVLLVTEPAGDAFDLFDDAVVALGSGVRPSCRLRLNPLIYRR